MLTAISAKLWPQQSAARSSSGFICPPRPGLAGGIGLEPAQQAALQAGLTEQTPCLLQPGLLVDSFACWQGQRPVHSPAQWEQILQAGQVAEVTGAFVLAWQTSADHLQLLRDAPGERSLFYAPVGQGLIFATSLRDLLASGLVARELNLLSLARYLSYAYVPGRETLIQGVYQVLPGELVSWQAGQLRRRCFWELPYEDLPETAQSESDYCQRLQAVLEQAVLRRLSPAPVHASLSGGLDSSLVVALLTHLQDQPVHTWSLSFGGQHRNELPFSQAVADHCGTQHQVLEIQPKTVFPSLDRIMAQLGSPIGDPLTVPNAQLFEAVSQHSSVLFNGEGGDPNFGGPKNIPMLLAELYGDACHNPLSTSRYPREQTYLRSYRKCYADLQAMLRPEALAQLPREALEAELAPFLSADTGQSLMANLMRLNTVFKGAHHILFKVNALSAAQGVQPASPLFDRELSALAAQIPASLRLHGAVEKHILKQAAAGRLPRQILERPKSGMQVPIEGWLQPGGPLHRAARQRLLSGLAAYPYFERAWLERLLNWQLPGFLPRHGAKVWILLTLEAWLRHHLPR